MFPANSRVHRLSEIVAAHVGCMQRQVAVLRPLTLSFRRGSIAAVSRRCWQERSALTTSTSAQGLSALYRGEAGS